MDGPGPGSIPRSSGFDGPLADATAAIGASANALRAARQQYRETYQAQQAEWRRLRAELDELELRVYPTGARDRTAVMSPAGPGAGTGGPTAQGNPMAHGRPMAPADVPGGAGDESEADVVRLRELRARLEAVETDLGRHRAELARLDLAVESLENTWLFLARNDGAPMLDSSSPSSAGAVQMRIVEAQEAERSRLAQEIHDGPAQSLTNAIFQVQYVERLLEQDPAGARSELRYLGELLRRELSDVRSYISQLRPPLLDQLGLDGAIRDTADYIGALSGIEIRCDLSAPEDALDEPEQTVVLRIAQEALQNVRKHARANHASVHTGVGPDGWVLEIQDDGRGFDDGAVAARGRRNFGLQFMRERAGLIGARFEVRSKADGGTTVRLTIPTSRKEGR